MTRFAVTSLVAFLLSSCGATTPPSNTDAGSTAPDAASTDLPPSVAITNFAPFDLLKDSMELTINATDDLGVTKIEIFLGESTTPEVTLDGPSENPVTLALDSRGLAEGATTLRVRATDTTGHATNTANIPAVVCNNCTVATLAPAQATLSIPATPTAAELDLKSHWTNPSGIHKILGVASWSLPAGSATWNLELSVGRGECPDAGVMLSDLVASTVSPISVEALPQSADVMTGMHFIHVRPVDAADHKGEQLLVKMKVFLWP